MSWPSAARKPPSRHRGTDASSKKAGSAAHGGDGRGLQAGVADLDDLALKERITGLKVIRDQSRVDADRAQAMLDSTGERAITPEMVGLLSQAARERLRLDGGGYRRDHLRALAQRVEVGDDEVRIMGSKSDLLRTLVAARGGKSAAIGVPRRGPKWRTAPDPDEHYVYAIAL